MHERFLEEIDDPELWHAKRQGTVDLFELLERPICRHQGILAHFDEVLAGCATSCDVCALLSVEELAAEGIVAKGERGRSRRRARGGASAVAAGGEDTPEVEELFQRLRSLRKELADRQNVPAYIVFSDQVLREMAVRKPGSPLEMLAVPGVGPAKLERYGDAFLEEIGGG
jgi:ATP-dependent DNA helicase RecQ